MSAGYEQQRGNPNSNINDYSFTTDESAGTATSVAGNLFSSRLNFTFSTGKGKRGPAARTGRKSQPANRKTDGEQHGNVEIRYSPAPAIVKRHLLIILRAQHVTEITKIANYQ